MSDAGEKAGAGERSAVLAPPPERWLEALRRAVDVQREIFRSRPGIADRTRYEGIGEGGDRALEIDRLCEEAVFAELQALHAEGAEFAAISEERGEVGFGDGGPDGAGASPLRVVIDPIDGSLNARRTIPFHSLSVAVADGDSMADVWLGYVYEFGAGEEFVAVRGEGARLDGEPISAPAGDGLELVAMEAAKPERVAAAARELARRVYRIRSSGSIAVSLCYVAAGRFDGMLGTRPCRSVDAAAGQLVVAEAGGALAFGETAAGETPLDLDARFEIAAARTAGDLAALRRAQRAIP